MYTSWHGNSCSISSAHNAVVSDVYVYTYVHIMYNINIYFYMLFSLKV